jgi:hypothetical protein
MRSAKTLQFSNNFQTASSVVAKTFQTVSFFFFFFKTRLLLLTETLLWDHQAIVERGYYLGVHYWEVVIHECSEVPDILIGSLCFLCFCFC